MMTWDEQQRHEFNCLKIQNLGINPLKHQQTIALERVIESKKYEFEN